MTTIHRRAPPQPGLCSVSSTSPGLGGYPFPILDTRRIPDEFPSVAQALAAGRGVCWELNQVSLLSTVPSSPHQTLPISANPAGEARPVRPA